MKSNRVTSDIIQKAKESETMKAAINILLDADPYLKPLEICKLMDWDYAIRGRTVISRKCEWRKSLIYGLGSKGSKFAPDSQHHVSAVAFVPKCLDRRDPEVTERAIECRWRLSRNRNQNLIWGGNRELGRIQWFVNGRVKVHVEKPHNMARVKRLVSLAFFSNGLIFDSRIFSDFVDSFEWKEHHDVYHTLSKRKLPYIEIRSYRKYGFVIKAGDKSHPYDIEVEYVKPEWAEKLEFLADINIKTIEKFSDFMKELNKPKPLDPRDKSII